jgi:hypothetical protein
MARWMAGVRREAALLLLVAWILIGHVVKDDSAAGRARVSVPQAERGGPGAPPDRGNVADSAPASSDGASPDDVAA